MSNDPGLIERLVRPLAANDVRTDDTDWYPDIQPRRYSVSPKEILEAVRTVVDDRERWQVVDVDRDEFELEAEVHTEWLDFVDDLTVWIATRDDGESIVHARSRSRVGEGDFGQNARTIRELFERLDEELGA